MRTVRRPRAAAGVAAVAGSLLLAVACGGGEDRPDDATAGDAGAGRPVAGGETRSVPEGAAAADSARAGAHPAAADSADPGESVAARTAAGADDPRLLRTRPLRLVNLTDRPVVVAAEAGAGSVVLDTVPARDSVRLRVETRSGWLRLRATADAGREVARDSVVLRQDSATRWAVGPPPSGG